MTNTQNLGQTVTALRKSRSITQEQLADALGISSQSVSKWETGATLPDISLLPALADYFDVSIDYLFHGESVTYGDLRTVIADRVQAQPYENGIAEFMSLSASAFFGLHCGNLRPRSEKMNDAAALHDTVHHGGPDGLATYDTRGMLFGVTRDFFAHVNAADTAACMANVFSVLGSRDTALILLSVLSMDDISTGELSCALGMTAEELRPAIDTLIAAGLLTETASKHKSLGSTYHISETFLPTATLLCAAAENFRFSQQNGFSCCLGPGDYPIGGLTIE